MSLSLKEKIINKKAKIGIIGLGYVGLPMAVEFARAGFEVRGIDIDKGKIEKINKSKSYILDVNSKDLAEQISRKKLKVSSSYEVIRNLDVIIICVPTPLNKTREPDISYVVYASRKIGKLLKKEQLVILESTTYAGTTEEVILPILESSGLKADKDFYLAFSPERIDPGNKKFSAVNIPKVVGGVGPKSAELVKNLYKQVINKVVMVSSARCAEMTKLFENTFRNVNIALANELALMCEALEIDVWEVIEAASTKPFGFMPFYPGPGLGGHCIPIDPLYLSWKARLHGFETRLVDLAAQINAVMPDFVVTKVNKALNEFKKPLKGSKVLILGVSYKKEVSDTRESPAFEIISKLLETQAKINYFDPYVPSIIVAGKKLKSVTINKSILEKQDCVVLLVAHSVFDYEYIAKHSVLIIDTRNVFGRIKSKARVIKL